jgi:DNA-binding transcriptional ArsR family regulator
VQKQSSICLTIGGNEAILVGMPSGAAQLDRVFHALADTSRRTMVRQLSEGPASVSELARPLSMTLAAVVQHVQVLETCGLISTTKAGRTRTCRINPAALHSAEEWISTRRRGVERRLDRLGKYLEEDQQHPKGTP